MARRGRELPSLKRPGHPRDQTSGGCQHCGHPGCATRKLCVSSTKMGWCGRGLLRAPLPALPSPPPVCSAAPQTAQSHALPISTLGTRVIPHRCAKTLNSVRNRKTKSGFHDNHSERGTWQVAPCHQGGATGVTCHPQRPSPRFTPPAPRTLMGPRETPARAGPGVTGSPIWDRKGLLKVGMNPDTTPGGCLGPWGKGRSLRMSRQSCGGSRETGERSGHWPGLRAKAGSATLGLRPQHSLSANKNMSILYH